jgi:hypothetical protein
VNRSDKTRLTEVPSQEPRTPSCDRCGTCSGRCADKDPLAKLASLEAARKAAYEAEEDERWDGLA